MKKISNINKALRYNFKDAKKALSRNLDTINDLPAKEVDVRIREYIERVLFEIDNILKALGRTDES